MKKSTVGLFAASLALSALGTSASAATIVSYTTLTNATSNGTTNAEGESVLTPTAPAGVTGWDDIEFNWYTTSQLTPLADGSLFILTEQYTGTPAGLSSSTAGFVAESTSIVADGSGSAYAFATNVVLNTNTEYFFYSNATENNPLVDPAAGAADLQRFRALGVSSDFLGPNNSTNLFALTGVAVPEPATWALMLIGLGGVGATLRSRRKHLASVATA